MLRLIYQGSSMSSIGFGFSVVPLFGELDILFVHASFVLGDSGPGGQRVSSWKPFLFAFLLTNSGEQSEFLSGVGYTFSLLGVLSTKSFT